MTLNSSQRQAVDTEDKQVVVMSGPGSGKTRVAVERVSRLRGRIVVLTFTNAAAREFRDRIRDRLLENTSIHDLRVVQRFFCGTLHSYCFKLIREFGTHIGYGHGNVALLPESDRMELFKSVREKLGYKGANKEHERKVRDEYYFTLKRNNLVDYDRILEEGLRLLQIEEVRKAVACDDLIVEEAQDSAKIDWEIYRAIPANNLFVIGDVDQAIFEFRKAYPQGFLDMARAEGTTVFKLEENYRCARAICDAANKLIRHNHSRYEKDTVSATGELGEIRVGQFDDAWSELTFLARLVKANEGRSVAVLARTNYEVKRVRDFFASCGVGNVFIADARDPYPSDWRRAVLVIGLAASPYNEVIAQQLLSLDHDPLIVAGWKLDAQANGTYLADRLLKYAEKIGILRWLAQNGIQPSTIRLIEERTRLMAKDASLSDLLQDLYSDELWKRAPEMNSLFLGTIHSAKGREFDVVFLPAFEESKLNEDNIEEERRLAFVAVTRARSALYISYASRRTAQWGIAVDCEPSRFIGEMGLSPAAG